MFEWKRRQCHRRNDLVFLFHSFDDAVQLNWRFGIVSRLCSIWKLHLWLWIDEMRISHEIAQKHVKSTEKNGYRKKPAKMTFHLKWMQTIFKTILQKSIDDGCVCVCVSVWCCCKLQNVSIYKRVCVCAHVENSFLEQNSTTKPKGERINFDRTSKIQFSSIDIFAKLAENL